jgi:phosphoglycolate phosphatase
VGADSVAAHKPDASHFLETVSRAGGAGAPSFLIGDTNTDAVTAKAAGVPFVLVRFGYGDADTIARTTGADALIDGFEELPALARTLLER